MPQIKRALISVSDKNGILNFAKDLIDLGVEIISTGGTFSALNDSGLNIRDISSLTNFPEILDGRVKTLHPGIHAGILNKRESKLHLKDLRVNNFENIDLVIVNFYPFEETLKSTKNHNKIVENIDVGGPTMVRSAAKNYHDVTVITSADQYEELIDELKKNKGSTSLGFREKLSRIAFSETAYYDSVISDYFNNRNNVIFPKKKVFHANLIESPRYGENPHQKSAIYSKNTSLKLDTLETFQLRGLFESPAASPLLNAIAFLNTFSMFLKLEVFHPPIF